LRDWALLIALRSTCFWLAGRMRTMGRATMAISVPKNEPTEGVAAFVGGDDSRDDTEATSDEQEFH
jgi:hypothetical protein